MAKPASRVSDLNACPLPGHGTNAAISGSPDVLFNGLPALRVGDRTACGDTVAAGMENILINGKTVAFLGSATAHGATIVTGSPDVLVGSQSHSAPFAAPDGCVRNSEQYQLFDEHSGAPVAGMLYCVECADGQRLVGYTDAHGNTPRVFTAEPADVVVRWGRAAASHLQALGIRY